MVQRPDDEEPGPAGTGPAELADRQFAEALAAYDEALAAGQPVPPGRGLAELPLVEPQRLGDARAIVHLLNQIHPRSPAGVPSPTDPLDGDGTTDVPGQDPAALQPAADLEVIAGRYFVERMLGRGGMGVVYLAYDRPLHRHVALKMISALLSPSPDLVQRFWAEAEAAGRLQHPNIVSVYDVGLHRAVPAGPEQPFLVMEYIAGTSLRDQLTGQPWPERPAAQLVATLARAIHYAHQRHIIHRDLNPANILLQRKSEIRNPNSEPDVNGMASDFGFWMSDFELKVSDFGVAKQLDSGAGLTRSGEVIGTPQYMAPEQAQGRGQEIGPATDIYALGVILYELLTGRPPFQGVMPLDIQLRVICEEPLPPRRLQPALARDLDTICLKCLAKDPRRRYATAEALADDLARFLAGQPIVARPVSWWERLRKWVRRQPVVATLLALVMLVTLLGVAGITWKWLDAEAGWAKADEQRQHAETTERDARALAAAEKQARLATELAEAQVRAKAAAEASARERTEWALYGSRLTQAMYAWKDSEPNITRDLLAACPLSFRHWEYAYLRRLTSSNQRVAYVVVPNVAINHIAVAPDGRRALLGLGTGRYHLVDVETGKRLRVLDTRTKGVDGICFSRDGQRCASLQATSDRPDGQLCVWDATKGDRLLTVAVPAERTGGICFSPDGQQLVYGGRKAVHVVDAGTGKELRTIGEQTGDVHGVVCSSDGRTIAAIVHGGQAVQVWDATTGQLVHTLQGHGQGLHWLAVSPDSRSLAAATDARTIRVWDLPAGQLRHVLQGHTDWVTDIGFGPQSRWLVSCSYDRTVRLWDVITGHPIRILRGNGAWTTAAAFAPAGDQVITGTVYGVLKFWDARRDQECWTYPYYGFVQSAGVSPDGTRLAIVNGSGLLLLVDAHSARTVCQVPLDRVRMVQYSPDGRWLFLRREGQPLERRDAANGQLLHTYEGDPSGVVAFALDASGQRIASIDGDQVLKARDVLTGRLLIPQEKLPNEFRAGPLCFSGDGRWLFLGNAHGDVQVRDAATAQLRRTISGHRKAISCLAASADGCYLASGSVDRTVKLWDVPTGHERATLRGHSGRVTAVTFTPDGKRLVSGCYERAIKMWGTANGQELLPLPGHRGSVTSLTFSADGRWLLSSSEDGSVRLWDAGEHWSLPGVPR